MELRRKGRIFREGRGLLCEGRAWGGWVHVYGVRLMHACYENRIGWHAEGSIYELLFCFLI